MEDLQRYDEMISENDLADVILGRIRPGTTTIGVKADLTSLKKTLDKALSSTPSRQDREEADLKVAQTVYKILKSLPPDHQRDFRFWQWLSVEKFPEFVWHRWAPLKAPFKDPSTLEHTGSLSEHYLGAYSLRGFSRHAFTRYWFGCDTLKHTAAQPRDLFKNQQLIQDIFEREIGLSSSVAAGMVLALKDVPDTKKKYAAKLMSHLDHVIYLDTLTAKQISKKIESYLSAL